MAPGTASVRAWMQNVSNEQTVAVVPNFGGRWDGDFAVTSCNAGPFLTTTLLCADQFRVGALIPVSLMLTQAADHVAGPAQMTGASSASGSWSTLFAETVSGTIDGNSRLILQGELMGMGAERNGNTFRVTIRDWTATIAGISSLQRGRSIFVRTL